MSLRAWALVGALAASGCAPSIAARMPASALGDSPTQVEGFVRELTKLEVTHADGSKARLEALITRPDRPGKLPLVLLIHGSPREQEERPKMSPTAFASRAMDFARRGYAAVVVLRRGFGRSEGEYAELSGPCDRRDYLVSTRASAEDVLGAVHTLQAESWVDPERVLLVGMSTGGFAVLGTAATNPKGVAGVISFAGGRGSDRPDHVCQADRLVDAVRELGRTARVPSLWIYAENDHFFGPFLAQQMAEAYTKEGGVAELQLLPAWGDDGHLLFSRAPFAAWWPRVAPFLAKLGLPTEIERPAAHATLEAPSTLEHAGRVDFGKYLESEGFEKAFAVSGTSWGWATGKRTRADAVELALKRCDEHAKGCTVYAVGDGYVR